MANDRMQQYAQHQAELLSDEDGTATVVKIQGKDIILEYSSGVDTWRGVLYDGESLADIRWQSELKTGWPLGLR